MLRAIKLLLGLTVAAGPSATVDSGLCLVDYFHEAPDGTSYHGTISNLDGEARSTWTIAHGAEKQRLEQPISKGQYEALLAGFGLPELKQYEVTRDDQVLDFQAYQVLSVVTLGADHRIKQRRTFLVPLQPTSPKIAGWLKHLSVPTSPR